MLSTWTMSRHTFKLTYLNGRGYAEISRLLFALVGQEYEDERWDLAKFQENKMNLPFTMVPLLEVDGEKYCQGFAISRFLAREFGLMGSDNIEVLKIEEIQECMTDLLGELKQFRFEPDEQRKREAKNKTFTAFLPRLFEYLTMRLKENNGGHGFFVGDKLSYADLVVYRGFEMCQDVYKTDVLEDSNQLLQSHYKRVMSQPNINAWLQKRPESDF